MTRNSFLVFQLLVPIALCASAALLAFPQTSEAAATLTFLQFTDGDGSNEQQQTFTSVNLGTASSDRIIFVVLHGEDAATTDPTSMTIAGISATEVLTNVDPTSNGDLAGIWYANVPTGTSGNIVINYANFTTAGIGVYSATGIGTSPTAYDTASDLDDVLSMSIDVPQGGILIAGASNANNATAYTTVGGTEDYDFAMTASGERAGGASASSLSLETNRTVSFDAATGDASSVAATFAPSGGGGASRSVLVKPPNNLGLVGYWSFNEGTSTKATDFSGNGNTGTLTTSGSGVPTWTNGKRGAALNFSDTINGYVELGDQPGLFIPGSLTISAWVKPNPATPGFSRTIFGDVNAAGDKSSYDFYMDHVANTFCFFWENPTATLPTVCSNTAAVSGRWYHVLVTWDGTTRTMYVNGVADGTPESTAQTRTDVGGNNTIGVPGSFNSAHFFNGLIDEVRIYNRALSAAEVATLYAGGTAGAARANASSVTLQNGTTLGPANGLVGHWTFDGGDVRDKVYDRSGQNNNGYIYNVATSSAKTIGKLGQALNFDGTNDSIQASSALGAAQDFYTMSAWVNGDALDASPNATNIVVHINDKWIGTYYQSATELWWVCNKDADFMPTSPPGFTTGWHLLTCTYDGAADLLTLYLDGVQINQAGSIVGAEDLTGTVDIGGVDSASDYYWDGKIDDVRLYNRALTAAEVKQLYKLGGVTVRQ